MLEEEICDMSLSKLSRAEKSVHNDKIETPKINAIEINEKPRENDARSGNTNQKYSR